MKSDRCRGLLGVAVVFSILLGGCGESTQPGSGGGGGAAGGSGGGGGHASDPFAGCTRGDLEADLAIDPPLSGPGVDPKTHALAAGHYTIATTYLALVPEQAARASQLGGAVVQTLPKMKGLVAFSLASSRTCATLRTMTVWESEEDMATFVASPAHAKAMGEIHTLSRGASDVTAFEGNEGDATWKAAAGALAKLPGTGL